MVEFENVELVEGSHRKCPAFMDYLREQQANTWRIQSEYNVNTKKDVADDR